MKVVAFLPVRGTSDSLLNKNLQNFFGEPLYLYTLRKLLGFEFIDEVYVDSNDAEILAEAKRLGANVMRRTDSLASKSVDGNQLFTNEIMQVESDIYLQCLCTSPFVQKATINKAVELLREQGEWDSVVLVREDRLYVMEDGRPSYGEGRIPNRVELETITSEAMGFYAVKREVAHKNKKRVGERPYLLPGTPLELVDIKTPDDLVLAKYVASGLRAEENRRLDLLRTVLSSPVLSDVCDELGLNCVLPPDYSANIPGVKLLGRARTVKIRSAQPEDCPVGIYDALESYDFVVDNDIIVVGTDCPELAYFGELNMSLAIRAGASGTIIGGVTRDTARTTAARFPVFAKGRFCKDIKGRGVLDGINVPLNLDGVELHFGDLVFADEDGIVVIPQRLEENIFARALEVITGESKIIRDIIGRVDASELVEKHGFF